MPFQAISSFLKRRVSMSASPSTTIPDNNNDENVPLTTPNVKISTTSRPSGSLTPSGPISTLRRTFSTPSKKAKSRGHLRSLTRGSSIYKKLGDVDEEGANKNKDKEVDVEITGRQKADEEDGAGKARDDEDEVDERDLGWWRCCQVEDDLCPWPCQKTNFISNATCERCGHWICERCEVLKGAETEWTKAGAKGY